MSTNQTDSFYTLEPHIILDALEGEGFECSGRCLQLNSLENRVYEVELENNPAEESCLRVVSKFYRPKRWTHEQIQEEHSFLQALKESDIPVVAPFAINGKSLFTCTSTGIHFCIFPKFGGRNMDEFSKTDAERLGRQIARIHLTGSTLGQSSSRERLSLETFGYAHLDYLQSNNAFPAELSDTFDQTLKRIFNLVEPLFNEIDFIKLHGDAHPGNILKRDEEFYFVDFDDMRIGPAVQDIWLLNSGREEYHRQLLQDFLAGYQQMRHFNHRELFLIEPLRTLRVLHFIVWIHQRWDDAYFKRTFENFNTNAYWSEQLQFFYEQFEIINTMLSSGDPLGIVQS